MTGSDCQWCLDGDIPGALGNHEFYCAIEGHYWIGCKRGPIERELRAYNWKEGSPYKLSKVALDVVFGAYENWRMPGVPHGDEDWKDIASEAIEAAAALHEKGML